MTPPPSVLPGSQTGFRKTRRRAPVSDRPVVDPLAGSLLPTRGALLSEQDPKTVYVGLDWAAVIHAVCVMSAAGKSCCRFFSSVRSLSPRNTAAMPFCVAATSTRP